MQIVKRLAVKIIVAAFLSMGFPGVAKAELSSTGKVMSVRVSGFSLSPGERISAIRVVSSAGYFSKAVRINQWRCDLNGRTAHCYSTHPMYALSDSGNLPELSLAAVGDRFSLSANMVIIDGSGREYSREIPEAALDVR